MTKIANTSSTDSVGVGDCPSHLLHLTRIWSELALAIPPGVAANADRIGLELCTRLTNKMRVDGLTASESAQLRALLSEFGLLPASRKKLCPAPFAFAPWQGPA